MVANGKHGQRNTSKKQHFPFVVRVILDLWRSFIDSQMAVFLMRHCYILYTVLYHHFISYSLSINTTNFITPPCTVPLLCHFEPNHKGIPTSSGQIIRISRVVFSLSYLHSEFKPYQCQFCLLTFRIIKIFISQVLGCSENNGWSYVVF